jgi:hypothetical protein
MSAIDQIDWPSLKTAYGTAIDAPRHVRALISGSSQEQDVALNYLWNHMWHQGSRYTASPFVVPFLFEALEQAERDQARFINLILAIAVGLDESFLPKGYIFAVEAAQLASEGWGNLFRCEAEKESYLAVSKQADALTAFVGSHFDAECRLSAGFALAHFAETLGTSRTDVRAALESERDPIQITNLLLCLGLLERHASNDRRLSLIEAHLSNRSRTVQLAAAIALATVSESSLCSTGLQILLAALSDAWVLDIPQRRWNWWNEGDLLGYAAKACTLVGHEEQVLEALGNALLKAPRSTFALQYSLLGIAFPDEKPPSGRDPKDFTPSQQRAVKALIDSRRWTSWMIDEYFLPTGLTGRPFFKALQSFLAWFGAKIDDKDGLRRSGNVSSWNHEQGI